MISRQIEIAIKGNFLQKLSFLQNSIKRINFKFHRFDPQADVTNLLNSAGSRRTVYLGDENKSDAEKPTTSNGNGEHAAPTFLMYNKISTTTVAAKESPPSSIVNGTNGNAESSNQKSKSDKKKNEKNRESAIWYKNIMNLRSIKKQDKLID